MKKKIIMYTPAKLWTENLTGGLKRFLELYNGLKKKEFDIILFTGDSPERVKQFGENIKSISYINPIKTVWIPSIAVSFFKNFKVIRQIKKSDFDSLIIFDVPTAIAFCILGVPKIDLFIRQDLISYKTISIQERITSESIQNMYLRLMKVAERICMLKARKIIVQCEYDKKQLCARHKNINNILDKKITVQINNVNPAWIVNKSKKDENFINSSKCREKSKSFKIGFTGDFNNERKGHTILIDAIKNLLDRGLNIEVILIGDGKQLPFLKEECRSYSQIYFAGRLDNPITITKQCDLIIVPSLADSCPNTVMEALYNKIPVIGARSGGIPEILQNEEALFEPNPRALQSKIEYFLDGKKLSNLRRQQQIRKNELKFDWPSAIVNHLRITESDIK